MSQPINIIIADDHPIFRRGLNMIIASDPSLKILAEASNGNEAITLIQQLNPQVAVLDIDMPKKNGFDVLKEIQALRLTTNIIFLTMHKDEALFNGALDLGAKGYLLKDSAVSEIIDSIKAVALGENFISPTLSTFLINRSLKNNKASENKNLLDKLTSSEQRILLLIAEDKTTKEIADILFISTRTVENHRSHICQKLDLQGTNALLRFALANKASLLK